MHRCLNLAAYHFTPFAADTLPAWRESLRSRASALGLRGTVLLSTEGINLFLAGDPAALRTLIDELRAVPGLAALEVKESWTDVQPFQRLRVKLKREIIAWGRPREAEPTHAAASAPKLAPEELKRWLDEQRPLVLLDTRNTYEVAVGTFRGAATIDLRHFRDFPDAVDHLPAAWRDLPVVTFCTGGIRCERAGPFLAQAGFHRVFQLDGGILNYFARCGGAHYEGACFVFDERGAVDPQIRPVNAGAQPVDAPV